jgi:hypothetical protein
MRVGCQKVDQLAQPYVRNRVTALLKDQWAIWPRENRDQGAREFRLVNQRAVLVTPFYEQDFPAWHGGSHPAHVNLPWFSELQLDVLSITKLVLDPFAFDEVRCVVLDARVGGLHVSDDPENILRSLYGWRAAKHEKDEEKTQSRV